MFLLVGGIFARGPGLTVVEATAVVPQGRITPECAGSGIQLAHAGQKVSTVAPWLHFGTTASQEYGGWPDDVWAPSAIPYNDLFPKPNELTKEGINHVVRAFVDAAKRALKAGFDVIEIHNAHGYLLHEFLSPVSNKRTDEYGGSFENRIRLTLETVDAVRAIITKDMPLFLRVSVTDWLVESLPNEPFWTLKDTVRLAGTLAAHGVDLLDVSSGGFRPAQRIALDNGEVEDVPILSYQAPFAEAVRKEHGIETATKLLGGAVGEIKTGPLAEVLQKGMSDVVFVARQFLRDPASVLTFAEQLGVKTKVANQLGWGIGYSSSGRRHRAVVKY